MSLVARSIIARQGQGSVVNVASILGLVGVGQIPDAGMPRRKAGLVSMTRELAAQWARQGVRVKRPGARLLPQRDDRWDDVRQRTLGGVDGSTTLPWGEEGMSTSSTEHCSSSPRRPAAYVTGAVIPSTGGWTAILNHSGLRDTARATVTSRETVDGALGPRRPSPADRLGARVRPRWRSWA